MDKAKRKRVLRGVAAAYVLALVAVSLLPSGEGRLGGWDAAVSPGIQNLLHVPAYAGLAVLVSLAWDRRAPVWRVGVAVGCAAFGAGLEFAQAAIPGRMGSVMDAVLNVIGAGLGAAGVVAVDRIRATRAAAPAARSSEGG